MIDQRKSTSSFSRLDGRETNREELLFFSARARKFWKVHRRVRWTEKKRKPPRERLSERISGISGNRLPDVCINVAPHDVNSPKLVVASTTRIHPPKSFKIFDRRFRLKRFTCFLNTSFKWPFFYLIILNIRELLLLKINTEIAFSYWHNFLITKKKE